MLREHGSAEQPAIWTELASRFGLNEEGPIV